MTKELQLTAEELYYAGKLYEGKYLNYAYIAAMSDIGNNKRSFRNRCREALCEKGVIEENLLGDVSFNEEIKDFLSPIYFGKFTASVEIYHMGKEKNVQTIYFHCYKGNYLMVYAGNNVFEIKKVEEKDLKSLIFALMPDKYNESSPPKQLDVSEETLKRILVLKNLRIGDTASVNIYYDYDSYLCEKNSQGSIRVLSPKDFCDKAFEVLKGDEQLGV